MRVPECQKLIDYLKLFHISIFRKIDFKINSTGEVSIKSVVRVFKLKKSSEKIKTSFAPPIGLPSGVYEIGVGFLLCEKNNASHKLLLLGGAAKYSVGESVGRLIIDIIKKKKNQ